MIEAILSGMTFGLALAFMLGPVFFTLLQTSLQEGLKAGIHVAAGVFLSDSILIVFCFVFASQLQLMNEHKETMGLVGGSVLCIFGLFQAFKKTKVKDVQDQKKAVHAQYLLKGFMLNTLNPMVLIFWLSVVGIVSVREQYTRIDELAFFLSVVLTVFCTDFLKCLGANRLKRVLNDKVIHRMNLVTGIILIGFGLEMLLRVLIKLN
jgi:threonine/homoserine/homoserine lactone efflux protein